MMSEEKWANESHKALNEKRADACRNAHNLMVVEFSTQLDQIVSEVGHSRRRGAGWLHIAGGEQIARRSFTSRPQPLHR